MVVRRLRAKSEIHIILEKALRHFSHTGKYPGYILFLTAAMVVTALVLIFYIRLQSEITGNVKTISRLESELNTLKLSNDEAYSRATGNVDLEKVKQIAIGELGMTYATEGQIVTYSGEGSDYVKQVAEIP